MFLLFTPRLDTAFMTLFWSMFALIALVTLEVNLSMVERFGKLLFGLYNVAAKILLLNMLIAMMSKSFNSIVVRTVKSSSSSDL